MNGKAKKKAGDQRPPEPIDVVDGIADRSPRPTWWKYVLLLLIFLVWIALLLVMKLAGSGEVE